MPTIERLILKNFKRFQFFDVSFDDKMNILSGGNEAGKSSLLQAIDIALSDPRNITKLEAQGKLLGILLPVWGQRIYPTFQFDATTLKPQIAELLSYLPRDPNGWAQAMWLISSNKQLGGSAPIDMAEDLAALVQAISP